MYNINFIKVQYKVNIHIVIRKIKINETITRPVKSNTQDERNTPTVIMNNIGFNESVFMWSSTI